MSMTSGVILLLLGLSLVALRRLLGSRTLDATWLSFLKVPFNEVAFRVRRRIGWRRGPAVHANEPKADLFDYLENPRSEAKRERELRERYDLEALAARSSREVYRDNVYMLDLLDRLVTPKGTKAIDVGSKDFRYAFALERFLVTKVGAPADLLGAEIDGHPVYADGRSRVDHAEAYAAEVEAAPRKGGTSSRVRYRVADFLEVDERDVDVVFFFFPFVLRYALVRWGLPLGNFVPDRLFEHAVRMLRPGGLLVIVNHTQEELAAQRAILENITGLDVAASTDASSKLVDYFDQLEGRALTIATKTK